MKFQKYLQQLKKDQLGFTLVEIIITLSIFAIVLTVAGNFLFFGNNMYAKTEVKNTEKYIGDSAFEHIKKRLTYAVKLEVINPDKTQTPQFNRDIMIKNGQLWGGPTGNEKNIFGEEFYQGGYQVGYEVKVLDENRLELKVKVLSTSNVSEVYSVKEILNVLNLGFDMKDEEKILVTNGELNKVYKNPVLSYEEEKVISTTYDPLKLKTQMIETARLLFNKTEPEDYFEIEGMKTPNYYMNNDRISAYVTQYYYKGKPYLGSTSAPDIYPYWPKFPGFEDDIIKNTDDKVKGITQGKTAQELSKFLEANKNNLKMKAYISFNATTGQTSCFVYVTHLSGQPWATRLVYSDEPGNTGWYYLASKKGKETQGGGIGDNMQLNDRIWKEGEGISSSKLAVYDEIMDTHGNSEGRWVKVD